MKNYKRSLKNFGKCLKGTAITAFGFAITPYAFPVGVLAIAKGSNELITNMQGNYIDNSMMNIQKNKALNKLLNQPNYCIKEGIPSLKQFLEATISKNKMNFLTLQEFNLLQGLDLKDEKGNKIVYNTTTHAGNYRMLRQLEKSGLIENLNKAPANKSTLLLEKAFIANTKSKAQDKEYKMKRISAIKERLKQSKGVFSKIKTLKEELDLGISKKTQMYKISFQKSEKDFDLENVRKLLPFVFDENGNINSSKYNIKYDEKNNIKGVDYTNKYIMQELKNRARNITKEKTSNFFSKLKEETRSDIEICNEKSKEIKMERENNIKTTDRINENEKVKENIENVI